MIVIINWEGVRRGRESSISVGVVCCGVEKVCCNNVVRVRIIDVVVLLELVVG